jgi:7-cyano-7-deazaguanine synthase
MKKSISKKAVVVHSGGMDSSICLALAIGDHGKENVLSMSFSYSQRHTVELERAQRISKDWRVDHIVVDLGCLQQITESSLLDKTLAFTHNEGEAPNTMVVGRNGLMARVAAIHADFLNSNEIYMGVIELEEANSGYRDCSRKYMDIIQDALRLDFNNKHFQIKTPIIFMDKKETMELALELGILKYLLETTVTCYDGIEKYGCGKCPACELRNDGITQFLQEHSDFEFSYKNKYLV